MGRQKNLRRPMVASRGVANSFIAPRAAALGWKSRSLDFARDDGCAATFGRAVRIMDRRFPTVQHPNALKAARWGPRSCAVGYNLSPLSGAVRRAWVCKIRRNAHGELAPSEVEGKTARPATRHRAQVI